jgi:DNA mismatch repair ATPase MutS
LYNSLVVSERILKDQKIIVSKKAKAIIEYIDQKINISEADGISELTLDFFDETLDADLAKIHDKWQAKDIQLKNIKNKLEVELDAIGKLRINEKMESYTLTGPKSLSETAKKKKIAIQIKASVIQIVDEEWMEVSKNCLHYRHVFLSKAQDVWNKFQLDFINIFGDQIIEISSQIAELDVLSNFAFISKERNYTRPKFINTDHALINLKNLRHPVLELSDKLTEGFVSNSISLGESNKTLVIYGANSAGKSTILKSVALNIILAQMGCFIAADKDSELSVFDAILTRMASFDSITDGLSTFTLEMFELQSALKFKAKKSIFFFDEIGRGTSVEDGEAIAYGTLAYLEDEKNKAITLFSTHYHSLVPELSKLKSIAIKNVSCFTNAKGELIFARKLEDGPGNGSYGIEVAKNCGIPDEIIRIANRYNKSHFKLKTSRYDNALSSSLCEYCKKNPFQQTHHIIEQKQGKVKDIVIDGQAKGIHDKSNLVMLCATCHEKVTRGEITIIKKNKLASGGFSLEVVVNKVKT